MNNCKNCKHHYEIDKVITFPGGSQHIFLDGYACTSNAEDDRKILWFADLNEETFCCDKFELKE